VKVNLYARMGKRWEEIGFTAPSPAPPAAPTPPPAPPTPAAPPAPAAPAQAAAKTTPPRPPPPPAPLGAFEGIKTDDQWHHARFDLLAALKKRDLSAAPGAAQPGKSPTLIDALAFASPDDPFLRCGLTGNPYGAAFCLDNFRVGR